MLQHAFTTSVPSALAEEGLPPVLQQIFHRVRLSQVEFNAQDVYQLCTTIHNLDTLGMMQDAEFMRGVSAAYQRSDQSVISPFQSNIITEVFRKANINVSPKDVAIPEEDALSPESLLNVLIAMNVTRTRDERKLHQTVKLMTPMLDEFSPPQMTTAIRELAKLRISDTAFMGKLAKRALDISDDLTPLDISTMALAVSYCKGVAHAILLKMFALCEERLEEFLPDDYVNVLQAIHQLGAKFIKTFKALVLKGLDNVENMDANTLTQFMICFVSLDYKNREHIEIYADSLTGLVEELHEKELVQILIAFQRLDLLSESVFQMIGGNVMMYTHQMDPRNISPVMEVCSSVPYNSDPLMARLLDRSTECTRILTAGQLGDILDIIALYPGARGHRIVEAFGKQCRIRMDLLGPEPLAKAVRGLSSLGHEDTQFYVDACETMMRWGFKDFSILEPILQGLCINADVTPQLTKMLGLYVIPMSHSMTLHEVERANKYMNRLQSEDEYVYRALANRVRVFIREVTPEMPQDLQILLQRGVVA